MQFLIRLLIRALAFMLLLPMVPGIHFHGNLLMAFLLAFFFGLMQLVVELVAIALSAYLAISTLGLGLLVLIPAWVLGFWLLPAIALKLVSDFVPQYLSVAGWVPAILGGLVLMLIGMVTSSLLSSTARPVD